MAVKGKKLSLRHRAKIAAGLKRHFSNRENLEKLHETQAKLQRDANGKFLPSDNPTHSHKADACKYIGSLDPSIHPLPVAKQGDIYGIDAGGQIGDLYVCYGDLIVCDGEKWIVVEGVLVDRTPPEMPQVPVSDLSGKVDELAKSIDKLFEIVMQGRS